MRKLVLLGLLGLLTAALAGCTQGSPGQDPDFNQSCPSWTKGPDSFHVGGPGFFHPNGTNTESWDSEINGTLRGFGVLERFGSPLDFIEMDFHQMRDHDGNLRLSNGTPIQQYLYVQGGTLQVQFLRNDTGEVLQAYNASRGPPSASNPASDTLTWEPGMHTNFTIRILLADPSEDPRPGEVLAHWMLLGPRTGHGDSSAYAFRETTFEYWYRTC